MCKDIWKENLFAFNNSRSETTTIVLYSSQLVSEFHNITLDYTLKVTPTGTISAIKKLNIFNIYINVT